eukprot:3935379-Rhodomonas_salina.1
MHLLEVHDGLLQPLAQILLPQVLQRSTRAKAAHTCIRMRRTASPHQRRPARTASPQEHVDALPQNTAGQSRPRRAAHHHDLARRRAIVVGLPVRAEQRAQLRHRERETRRVARQQPVP